MEDRFRFRVWDGETMHHASGMYERICFEGDQWSFESKHYGIFTSKSTKLCVVMACTGLKDKSGTLIYEGDILKGGCFNGSWAYGVVKWMVSGFVVVPIGRFMEGSDDINPTMEIKGNIHQNPDMK